MNKTTRHPALDILLVVLLVSTLYYIVRLPTSYLPLAFYDDGETLYHTLAILKGKVPHLEDFNHHFSGYLLPFIIGAKIFGFSADLIRQVAFVNQVLMALGVYLCLTLFFSRGKSMLGAALAITAREPWILGFYPQQELNLLFVFILYCTLRFTQTFQISWLAAASFLAGVSITYDQRAIFYSLIILFGFLLAQRARTVRNFLYLLIAGALPIFLALFYLWQTGALPWFVEQTYLFPRQFRIGSSSLAELILGGIDNHKYLVTKTPILLALACLGVFQVLRSARSDRRKQLLIFCALPLAIMPLFGGRDFDYYTLTWLPLLAIFAIFSLQLFEKMSLPLRRISVAIIVAPVALNVATSIAALQDEQLLSHNGDGVREVVSFLQENVPDNASLFVWGYRLEIPVRLNRLQGSPFGNQILIHPDDQVQGVENRKAHVYPKYEELFLSQLKDNPPEYIVVFNRTKDEKPYSRANQALLQKINSEYSEIFSLEREDFKHAPCFYRVYTRRT